MPAAKPSRPPEYNAWRHLLQRRLNETCSSWRARFANFLHDVGPRPSRLHILERLDPQHPYGPGNVRWARRRPPGRPPRSLILKQRFRGMPIIIVAGRPAVRVADGMPDKIRALADRSGYVLIYRLVAAEKLGLQPGGRVRLIDGDAWNWDPANLEVW
jgi:hypothetical protein